MTTTIKTAWIVTAIAVSLTGCSKTAEQSPVSDAAPAKADFPLSPKPQTVTIGEGTPIKIRTASELSTKTAKSGDPFTATLAEPIVIEGGAHVEGRVVNSDPGGRVKGVATISVRLTRIHVGNRSVEINTGVIARQAHATKRKDAAKVGIGAGIGAAIGAIAGGGEGAGTGLVLATHGDPAVIGAESVLTFKLTAPVTVEST